MKYDEITPMSVCEVPGFEPPDLTDIKEGFFANTNVIEHCRPRVRYESH
jgi:hypothetical protein